MIGEFSIMLALQLGALLVIGAPAAFALAARDRKNALIGWLLLAPAFGVTLYLGLGTGLHFLGLGVRTVMPALFAAAGLAAIFTVPNAVRRAGIGRLLLGMALLAAAAAVVAECDTSDIRALGLADYFPLTNPDAFVVLGNIDRIRSAGWNAPDFHYPAGFSLVHELYRAPGAVLVADFADLLGLGTHAAFFLGQRMALPVIILAASGIAALFGSAVAAMACFAGLVFANAILHQALQLFNASAMGTMAAPAVLALALWTARDERSPREFIAGAAALGCAAGTVAMTLPEAFPFHLLALAAVFTRSLAKRRQRHRHVTALLAFLAAALVTACPAFFTDLPSVAMEFALAAHGHPGDWIAGPAFAVQASGVTIERSASLAAYGWSARVAAFAFLAALGLAFAALGYCAAAPSAGARHRRSDLFVLFCYALVTIAGQLLLYASGAGYALLKLTDYFVFLPWIVVSVGLSSLGQLARGGVLERAVPLLLVAACVAFGAVAMPEKHRILDWYRGVGAAMPRPAAYRLPPLGGQAPAVVVPDLHGIPLQLFLYENRWGASQIAFRAGESQYFAPRVTLDACAGCAPLMARFPRSGIPGLPLADITYGGRPGAGSAIETVPISGQISIQAGDGWFDPEGDCPGTCLRWLSGHGDFTIFGGAQLAGRTLELALCPGPDLRPEDRIELLVAGRVLARVAPGELPKHVLLPLPAASAFTLPGAIAIRGALSGPRQVCVGQLATAGKAP